MVGPQEELSGLNGYTPRGFTPWEGVKEPTAGGEVKKISGVYNNKQTNSIDTKVFMLVFASQERKKERYATTSGQHID